MENTINVYGAAWRHYVPSIGGHLGDLIPRLGTEFTVYNSLSDFTIRRDSTGDLNIMAMLGHLGIAYFTYQEISATSYYINSSPIVTSNEYYIFEDTDYPATPYEIISDFSVYMNTTPYTIDGHIGKRVSGPVTGLVNYVTHVKKDGDDKDYYALITSATNFHTIGSKTYISLFSLFGLDIHFTEIGPTTIYHVDFASPNDTLDPSGTEVYIPGWNDSTEKQLTDFKTFTISGPMHPEYYKPKLYVNKYLYAENVPWLTTNEVYSGTYRYAAALQDKKFWNPEELLKLKCVNVVEACYAIGSPVVVSSSASAYPVDGPMGNDYYYQYCITVNRLTTPLPLITTLTDADLIGGVNYSIDINEDVDLNVGACASALISFKTRLTTLALNLTLQYSVKQFDLTVKQVGLFRITSLVKNGDIYYVTAYDFMDRFNVDISYDYIEAAYYNIYNHLTFLCELVGIEFEDDLSDHCLYDGYLGGYKFEYYWSEGTKKVQAREILSYLAAIGGCVAIMTPEGTLTFKKYGTSSSYTLDNTKYQDFEFSVYDIPPIDRLYIEHVPSGEIYSSGIGNNALYIMGNRAFSRNLGSEVYRNHLLGISNAIYNLISAIPTYVSATVKTYRDFGIEVGDCITVDDETVIVMSKSWTNSGVTFSSKGNQTRNILELSTKEKNDLLDLESKVDKLADAMGNSAYNKAVGGPNNKYGVITQYSDYDNPIGYWDKDGIDLYDITFRHPLYNGDSLATYLADLDVTARFG